MTLASLREVVLRKRRALGLIVVGLGLLAISLLDHVPQLSDLKPIEGRLISYSLHEEQGRTKVTVYANFHIEGYAGSFWNDSLKDASANLLHGREGVFIRTAYDPNSPFAGSEEATIESYGLSINGIELQSVAAALAGDRLLRHVVLPAIAILFIAVGFIWAARRRVHPG